MDANEIMGRLTYTERRCVKILLQQLRGGEGLITCSKLADSLGITRSSFVGGLRKLEFAGIVKTQGVGMKGTFIKVLKPDIAAALAKGLLDV